MSDLGRAWVRPEVIKVFVVEPHSVIRSALHRRLTPADGFTIVGETPNADVRAGAILACRPDVVVVDAILPPSTWVPWCAQLRAVAPRLRLVVLASFVDASVVDDARAAGASRCALKSVSCNGLLTAVRQAVVEPDTVDAVLRMPARPMARPAAQLPRQGFAAHRYGDRRTCAQPDEPT